MKLFGVADTTFARFDMGFSVVDELQKMGTGFRIIRYTVPGIKDLPVACLKLLRDDGCDLVVACGMPGSKPLDKISAQTASNGIMQAQLMTGKHILEVFVHEEEARNPSELAWLMDRRAREHAINAYYLVFDRAKLTEKAGKGLRQGYADVGPIEESGGGIRH